MKKIAVILLFLLLVNTLPLCGFAAEITVRDFENYTPPDATLTIGGDSTVTVELEDPDDDTSNHYLKIFSTISNNTSKKATEWRYAQVGTFDDANFDDKVVEITFDIRKPDTNASAQVLLYNLINGSTNQGAQVSRFVEFASNGKVYICGHECADYDSTKWYRFKFLLSEKKGYLAGYMKEVTDATPCDVNDYVGTFPVQLPSKDWLMGNSKIGVIFKQIAVEAGSAVYIDNACIAPDTDGETVALQADGKALVQENFNNLDPTDPYTAQGTTTTELNNDMVAMLGQAGLTDWTADFEQTVDGAFAIKKIADGNMSLYTKVAKGKTTGKTGAYRIYKNIAPRTAPVKIHAEVTPVDHTYDDGVMRVFQLYLGTASASNKSLLNLVRLMSSGKIQFGKDTNIVFDGVTYETGETISIDALYTPDITTPTNSTLKVTVKNLATNMEQTLSRTLADLGWTGGCYLKGISIYNLANKKSSSGGTYWDNISVKSTGYLKFAQPTILGEISETFDNLDTKNTYTAEGDSKAALNTNMVAKLEEAGLTGWTAAFESEAGGSFTGKTDNGNTALYTSVKKGNDEDAKDVNFRMFKTFDGRSVPVKIHAEVVPEDLNSMRVFQLYIGTATAAKHRINLVKLKSTGDIDIGYEHSVSGDLETGVLTYEPNNKIAIDVLYTPNTTTPTDSTFQITLTNETTKQKATRTKTMSDLFNEETTENYHLRGIGLRHYSSNTTESKTCWDNFSVTSTDISGATGTATLAMMDTTEKDTADYLFMLAAYDANGKMLGVVLQKDLKLEPGLVDGKTEYEKREVRFDAPLEGAVTYKAFVWDTFSSRIPWANFAEVSD